MGYSWARAVSQSCTYVVFCCKILFVLTHAFFQTAMYYRGAAIAIVVYDVTDSSSFESLKTWANELKELGPPDTVLGIVGNKIDLPEKRVSDFLVCLK